MNKSFFSWLLGISLVATAPVAMADKGDHKHGGQKFKQKHTQVNKQHQYAPKKFVKAKIHKRHVVKTKYRQSIFERRDNQARRIHKGIKKGQLVKFESRKLHYQQQRIANRIAKFRADGRLSRHEKAKIHEMLDRASKNIHNKRHNQYTRYNSRRNHKKEYIAYFQR